jgi:hypothetical protein
VNLVGGINGWVIVGILALLGVFALAALLIGWVVAPLAGTSPEERAGDCACGHPVEAHEHNRGGTECSLCTSCGSLRRPPLIGRRRARRTPAQDDGCAWCRPLGHYSDISILPSDCKCDGACDAPWCQARAVTG